MADRFSLQEIRERTYKNRDAWWTVWLVDPLASRLVWLVSPVRWVTPNILTFTAFLLGLGSAACFAQGDRGWLIAGAAIFHLSFVLDCMDGKIARLNGTGSAFGSWLDYVFDRLRVTVCAVALMGGQYSRTDDFIYIWLAGVVVFLDMFRYLNHLQMDRVWKYLRLAITGSPDPVETPEAGQQRVGPSYGPFGPVRAFLISHRIRVHLFSGIEFQMFIFIVGPVIDQIVIVTIVSGVLMTMFELVLIAGLYRASHRLQPTLNELSAAAALDQPELD